MSIFPRVREPNGMRGARLVCIFSILLVLGGGKGRWPSEQRWEGGWWVSGIAVPFCCILSDSRHTGRVAATRTEGLSPLITTVTTQAEARESRWKESEALTETDDSVIKPRTKGDIMKFDRDTERELS